MQVVFDGLLRKTYVLNKGRCFRSPPLPHATIPRYPSHLGDDNEFSRTPLPHLRKVSIQLRLRFLFAMSENVLLSVVSLLYSNKIATLPSLEELAFSCNVADFDNIRAPFDMSVWKSLDARAHQLSSSLTRSFVCGVMSRNLQYMSLSCRNPECCASERRSPTSQLLSLLTNIWWFVSVTEMGGWGFRRFLN